MGVLLVRAIGHEAAVKAFRQRPPEDDFRFAADVSPRHRFLDPRFDAGDRLTAHRMIEDLDRRVIRNAAGVAVRGQVDHAERRRPELRIDDRFQLLQFHHDGAGIGQSVDPQMRGRRVRRTSLQADGKVVTTLGARTDAGMRGSGKAG